MSDVPAIHGACDARFAAVREALARNFAEHGEVGAAVAITIDAKPVVDLWAGWMDVARTRPWQCDTLVDVFSVGKPVAVIALLRLVERGDVGLDAPVARYWPEFAAAGKDAVTVRMVLAHRAGLPAIRRDLPETAMYDWELMTSALAAEAPWWEPGTAHGYHVNTFGFLVGELVRRVAGAGIGAVVRRDVTGPLGADFHFGIGPGDDARIADYLFPFPETFVPSVDHLFPRRGADDAAERERRLLLQRAYVNPRGLSGFGTVNTRAWRAAEMPSTNGHTNARAVARIYAALVHGGAERSALLRPETIAAMAAPASTGTDEVLRRPSRFGLGVQLSAPEQPFGPNAGSFGHFGAGGSVGFADPTAGIAFAYTMNLPGPRTPNPRPRGLIDALYACL